MSPEPRRERKYLIDGVEQRVLQTRLARVLRRDPHAGPTGTYRVRSLYFDDPGDGALFEKLAGVRDRHKWRLRIYDDSADRIRLERKSRRNQGVRKDAALVDGATARALIAGSAHVGGLGGLVAAFAAEQKARRLRPVVIVDYVREAFVHRAGRVRVTLDRRLRSGLWSTELFDPAVPVVPVLHGVRRTILEVKSTGLLPAHVRALLPTTIPPAAALSKYVLCRRPMTLHRWEDP